MITAARLQLALVAAATACAGGSAPPAPRPSGPGAVIHRAQALFVFPAETTDTFVWDLPSRHAYAGAPMEIGEVRWQPPHARFGHDPSRLVLTLRWRPGGPRQGSLADVVAASDPAVATFCLPCTSPVEMHASDSNFTVRAVNDHVIFEVRGEAAVRRIFPVAPDSVSLQRSSRSKGELSARAINVPVIRRDAS